jgi:HSP20 family protein
VRPDATGSPAGRVQEGSPCDPSGSWQAQQQREKDVVDRAFEQLESEFSNKFSNTPNRRRGSQRSEDAVKNRDNQENEALRQQEYLRKQQEWMNQAFGLASQVASEVASSSPGKQQEWVNRAFGLATEVASEVASSSSGRDVKEYKNEAVRQQQEWVNRAFGIATDAASGLSSPRYEMNDETDAYQVTLDVPGVKASDIDISFNEEDSVLTVSGKRDISEGGVIRTVKFSKSFTLDSSVVDKDKISAQINNGVLFVTAAKVPIEPKEDKVRKIPVMEVGPESVPVQSSQTEEPTEGKKKNDEKLREDPNPENV